GGWFRDSAPPACPPLVGQAVRSSIYYRDRYCLGFLGAELDRACSRLGVVEGAGVALLIGLQYKRLGGCGLDETAPGDPGEASGACLGIGSDLGDELHGEQVHVILLALVAWQSELAVVGRRRVDEPAPAGGV